MHMALKIVERALRHGWIFPFPADVIDPFRAVFRSRFPDLRGCLRIKCLACLRSLLRHRRQDDAP